MTTNSLTTISGALKQGATTPTELVDAALAAAERSPSVFISLLSGRAHEEARAATDRWHSGSPRSPFDGIPYAVKDLFDLAGLVTSAGSRTRLGAAPAVDDAAVVASLSCHGLIPIGKTNLSEFAFSGLGLNPHFGTPTPGYDPLRVPGGSSSGTAIAIERGVVTIGLGTDTAGSMRVPAAFNGLVGFRPSQGRYDSTGVFPLAASFDVPGPMALTVGDVAVLDSLMRDGASIAATSRSRFILDTGLLEDDIVTPAVRSDILKFTDALRERGVEIELRRLIATTQGRSLISTSGWLGGFEAAAFHAQMLDGPDRSLVDPRVVRRLDVARAMTLASAERLRSRRSELMDSYKEEVGDAIVLTPTVGHHAPLLAPLEADSELFAAANVATLALTMVASFFDMPALAMPVGRATKSSIQLSAPTGRDDAVISAALQLEELGLDFI